MADDLKILKQAAKGVSEYLKESYRKNVISKEIYEKANSNVIKNLELWTSDKNIAIISPHLKEGVFKAVKEKRWEDIIDAFIDNISFGTAGIRGRSVLRAYDGNDVRDELKMLELNGIDAPILKGPNTINDIVLLLKSAGLAKYANDNGLTTMVVGHDSRIGGTEFAELVSKLFLAYGLKVFFFDSAVPYPELMFSVVELKAALGVYISASHNDKRYNGYKVCRYGAQINVIERNNIYNNYISKVTTADLKLMDLDDAPQDRLVILGESEKHEGMYYYDSRLAREIIDIHTKYVEHCKKFIVDTSLLSAWAGSLNIGYSAFHGTGGELLPRLMKELGFYRISITESMNSPDGSFPSFKVTESPDPGDPETMQVAIGNFVEEHGLREFEETDMFIGTDPDADRFGAVIKTTQDISMPPATNHVFLTADEAWSALLWYRLFKDTTHKMGAQQNAEDRFIVFSHVTTDILGLIAKKAGLGYIKTWVGFPMMAGAVTRVWARQPVSNEQCPEIVHSAYKMDGDKNVNVFACEQSNGFSIFGGRPESQEQFGYMGHVRDKDGLFASAMFAELAAYAKSTKRAITDILEQEIYCDKDIGLFVNYYETSPKSGQFEGIKGISKKINILKEAVSLLEKVNSRHQKISFGGLSVTRVEVYKTGKYDKLHNWVGFPDEGIRIFFSGDEYNYITIRPSGTSQSLRFYLQLRDSSITHVNVKNKREDLNKQAITLMKDIKKYVGAY